MTTHRLHPDGRNAVRRNVTPAEAYPPIVKPQPDPVSREGASAAIVFTLFLLGLALCPVVLVLQGMMR